MSILWDPPLHAPLPFSPLQLEALEMGLWILSLLSQESLVRGWALSKLLQSDLPGWVWCFKNSPCGIQWKMMASLKLEEKLYRASLHGEVGLGGVRW